MKEEGGGSRVVDDPEVEPGDVSQEEEDVTPDLDSEPVASISSASGPTSPPPGPSSASSRSFAFADSESDSEAEMEPLQGPPPKRRCLSDDVLYGKLIQVTENTPAVDEVEGYKTCVFPAFGTKGSVKKVLRWWKNKVITP